MLFERTHHSPVHKGSAIVRRSITITPGNKVRACAVRDSCAKKDEKQMKRTLGVIDKHRKVIVVVALDLFFFFFLSF